MTVISDGDVVDCCAFTCGPNIVSSQPAITVKKKGLGFGGASLPSQWLDRRKSATVTGGETIQLTLLLQSQWRGIALAERGGVTVERVAARHHYEIGALAAAIGLTRVRSNSWLTSSTYDRFNAPRTALAAHKPRTPFRYGHFDAIALGHLGRIGLGLMLAIEAPSDQAQASRSGVVRDTREPGINRFRWSVIGAVKLADSKTEFGNNLTLEAAGWTLKRLGA